MRQEKQTATEEPTVIITGITIIPQKDKAAYLMREDDILGGALYEYKQRGIYERIS